MSNVSVSTVKQFENKINILRIQAIDYCTNNINMCKIYLNVLISLRLVHVNNNNLMNTKQLSRKF